MSDQIDTLGHALPREIARCTELLKEYEAIGPAGRFGHMMISADIATASRAIAEGDTVAMIRIYTVLKEIK